MPFRPFPGVYAGVVPIKMSTEEGLVFAKEWGVRPDVVYIDADHHYAPAKRDIEFCLKHFPEAEILGDDWDYPDVRRAVQELCSQYNKKVIAEDDKCWTMAPLTPQQRAAARAEFTEQASTPALDTAFSQIADVLSKSDDGEELGRLLHRTNGEYKDLPLDYQGPPKKRTLLMIASNKGRTACVQRLLELGAQPNFRSKAKPETALHLAAFSNSVDVASVLLRHGADPSLTNDWNETPIQTARQKKHDKVARLIEGAAAAGTGSSIVNGSSG